MDNEIIGTLYWGGITYARYKANRKPAFRSFSEFQSVELKEE